MQLYSAGTPARSLYTPGTDEIMTALAATNPTAGCRSTVSDFGGESPKNWLKTCLLIIEEGQTGGKCRPPFRNNRKPKFQIRVKRGVWIRTEAPGFLGWDQRANSRIGIQNRTQKPRARLRWCRVSLIETRAPPSRNVDAKMRVGFLYSQAL